MKIIHYNLSRSMEIHLIQLIYAASFLVILIFNIIVPLQTILPWNHAIIKTDPIAAQPRPLDKQHLYQYSDQHSPHRSSSHGRCSVSPGRRGSGFGLSTSVVPRTS